MRHGVMPCTTFTARPIVIDEHGVDVEAHEHRVNGEARRDDERARRLEVAAAEQPLAAIAPRHRHLDALGERLVGALVDQPGPCAEFATAPSSPHLDGTAALSALAHGGGSRLSTPVVVQEIRLARRVEHLAVEHRLTATVAAQRRHLVEQIARMARPQRAMRSAGSAGAAGRPPSPGGTPVAAAAVHLEDAA